MIDSSGNGHHGTYKNNVALRRHRRDLLRAPAAPAARLRARRRPREQGRLLPRARRLRLRQRDPLLADRLHDGGLGQAAHGGPDDGDEPRRRRPALHRRTTSASPSSSPRTRSRQPRPRHPGRRLDPRRRQLGRPQHPPLRQRRPGRPLDHGQQDPLGHLDLLRRLRREGALVPRRDRRVRALRPRALARTGFATATRSARPSDHRRSPGAPTPTASTPAARSPTRWRRRTTASTRRARLPNADFDCTDPDDVPPGDSRHRRLHRDRATATPIPIATAAPLPDALGVHTSSSPRSTRAGNTYVHTHTYTVRDFSRLYGPRQPDRLLPPRRRARHLHAGLLAERPPRRIQERPGPGPGRDRRRRRHRPRLLRPRRLRLRERASPRRTTRSTLEAWVAPRRPEPRPVDRRPRRRRRDLPRGRRPQVPPRPAEPRRLRLAALRARTRTRPSPRSSAPGTASTCGSTSTASSRARTSPTAARPRPRPSTSAYGEIKPWFDGRIDEVAYYATALNANRVYQHFLADPPPPMAPAPAAPVAAARRLGQRRGSAARASDGTATPRQARPAPRQVRHPGRQEGDGPGLRRRPVRLGHVSIAAGKTRLGKAKLQARPGRRRLRRRQALQEAPQDLPQAALGDRHRRGRHRHREGTAAGRALGAKPLQSCSSRAGDA